MDVIIENGMKVSQESKKKQAVVLGHYLDLVLLIITYVGLCSCLIRSDFTFAVGLFCYFIKQEKWTSAIAKLQIALFLATFVFDVVYALFEIRVWFQNDLYQPIWQTIYPVHMFAIGTFLIQLVLKIIAFVLLFKIKGLLGK